MKTIATLFLLAGISFAFSQNEIAPPPVVEMPPIEKPALPNFEFISYPEAHFPGGVKELKKYILDHFPSDEIQYEKLPLEPSRVYVAFVVCYDGSIQDVQVVRGVTKELDALCVEFIETMPNWIPAEDRYGPVNSRIRLPISFGL